VACGLRYGVNKDGIRPPIIDTTNAKRRTLEAQGDANQVGNLQVKIKSLGVLEVQARNSRLMASTLDISSNPVNEVVYSLKTRNLTKWRRSLGELSLCGKLAKLVDGREMKICVQRTLSFLVYVNCMILLYPLCLYQPKLIDVKLLAASPFQPGFLLLLSSPVRKQRSRKV
jgi:hypothetical protein